MDQFGRFGRHTPVSKIIFRHNMIYHILIFHITHPLLHRRIMFDDGLFIAKLIIKHICYDQIGTGPGHIVSANVPVVRSHIGYSSIFFLRLFNIIEPFGVKKMIVKNITFSLRTNRTVTQPPHTFVTLRTVGRHAAIITAYTPISVLVNSVDHRVGGFQITRSLHFIINHLSLEVG